MRMPLILLAALCGTAAVAQSSFDPDKFIDRKNLSIADVNQLWRTLGINGKIRETTAVGSKDTDKTFDCGGDCTAQLLRTDWSLDEGVGSEAVVRISNDVDSNQFRFLLLHRTEEDGPWQLVDYLDLAEWDYDPPEISVVFSGGRRWLIVKAWPHCGTGCSLIHTDWFELESGKLKMVLSVPLSGHNGNQNPGRQFETRFVQATQVEAREILEFVYHVDFFPGFGSTVDADLWDDEKVIRYSRPAGKEQFEFDPDNSELSKAFVEEIFTSDELERPRLFELVQDHLLEIARGTDRRRRDWLKEVLEMNPNLLELTTVRAAFAQAR